VCRPWVNGSTRAYRVNAPNFTAGKNERSDCLSAMIPRHDSPGATCVVRPGPRALPLSDTIVPSRRSERIQTDTSEDIFWSVVLRQPTKKAGPSSIRSKNGAIVGLDESCAIARDTVRGVLTFVLCGVLIAPLLTSFLDAAAVVVTGWGHGYWPLGAERFWTNALAQLTIVPAVVLGGVSGISWIRNSNSARRWEAVLLGVSTVLVSVFVFGFQSAFVATTPALLYFPLPLLLWAAVRFRLAGLSVSLLCLALISMWYTMHGRLAFPYASMQQNILSLQILFCLVAVPLMFLSVVIDAAHRAQESLQFVSTRLLNAQEQERARIGRELHDDINQRLAMLAAELEQLKDNPSEVQSRVEELLKQTTEVSNDVQALSHELHSSKLEYLGVASGIRSWCKEFGERQGMEINFKVDVPTAISSEIGMTLFRILQESLHNAVKHSGVKHIDVQLSERSNEIQLTIVDAGKGFDVEAARQGRGSGLTSMQERVRLLSGSIEIQSKPMGGTTIHVCVPLEAAHVAQRAAG